MKKIVLGVLAHVDAGKTTLTECLLYHAKAIRKLGRVDHKDTFLDYYELEKQRGITIYSKETVFSYDDLSITLIDTPGHNDFSSEMERSLQVLDYAILVVSGHDGVQSHTKTIWNLLNKNHVPVFVFVNKMDSTIKSKEELMNELKELNDAFIEFPLTDIEECASLDEELIEEYLESETLKKESIINAIYNRKIFPVIYGSALKDHNVDILMQQFSEYTKDIHYSNEFGANVFRITHDKSETLYHLKVTGGKLTVKQDFGDFGKVHQIRRYTGEKYEVLQEVDAGEIAVVTGLQNMAIGQGLGNFETAKSSLEPFMHYRVISNEDPFDIMSALEILNKEDPTLNVRYDRMTKDIFVSLMGQVQIEIFIDTVKRRFGYDITLDKGLITYKETITNTVEGVGHFEPLRHYSEVHLLLEPGERGSGITVSSMCRDDELPIHFQRLIRSHIYEKKHIGVLTGSEITDIHITILGGRYHLKHTEPGDFREATYRAIRHALARADSILLEPYYEFILEVPLNCLSRAIFDLESFGSTYSYEETDHIIFTGKAPVSKLNGYAIEVINYTKGEGKLSVKLSDYEECNNAKEIIDSIHYDFTIDEANPCGSVFCKQGAGYYVPYNQVENHMHIPYIYKRPKPVFESYAGKIDDKELERIFERTYGPIKRKLSYELDYVVPETKEKEYKYQHKDECYLIDGYNVIFGLEDLNSLSKDNLANARDALVDKMCNFQGYRGGVVIVVFDGYKVKQNLGNIERYNNIYIVYTKEAQTADSYIERVTKKIANEFNIFVVTNDNLEKTIITGHNASRISVSQLAEMLKNMNQSGMERHAVDDHSNRNYLLDQLKELQ